MPQATTQSAPSTVFQVADVSPATTTLPEVPYKAAVEHLLNKPPSEYPWADGEPATQPTRTVEACSRYHGQLVAGVYFHPVVAAAHLAFKDHRPLVLSPDILWLLIAQGLANHVNANAEELRPRFVQHSGKAKIVVRRDDFIKGSLENPWAEVFDAFSDQIREHIGVETHDLLQPTFSTTGAVERAATQVVLMDTLQSYFAYECHTACGIPEVVLEGTTDDWEQVARRTRDLSRFGLEWWTTRLAPILDEFVAASRGQVNRPFWQSIYKQDGGSGGPYTTGWLVALFPYLKDWRSGLATWVITTLDKGHGPTTEAFPGGLSRAPFLWKYLDREFEMEFLGGFVGVRQEAETLRLRPEIGWAVREGQLREAVGN